MLHSGYCYQKRYVIMEWNVSGVNPLLNMKGLHRTKTHAEVTNNALYASSKTKNVDWVLQWWRTIFLTCGPNIVGTSYSTWQTWVLWTPGLFVQLTDSRLHHATLQFQDLCCHMVEKADNRTPSDVRLLLEVIAAPFFGKRGTRVKECPVGTRIGPDIVGNLSHGEWCAAQGCKNAGLPAQDLLWQNKKEMYRSGYYR